MSYFKKDANVERLAPSLPFLFRNEQLISPFSIAVTILALSFLGGFYSKLSLCFGISLLFFLGIIFFHTKSIAENLYLRRKVAKDILFEFEQLELIYTIVNASFFNAPLIWIQDACTVSHFDYIHVELKEGVRGNSKRIVRKRVVASSGMGMKSIGPVTLFVSDLFGFFEFRVVEDSPIDIKVLPTRETLPQFHLRGRSHSDAYGNYSQNTQGSSVNFIGVREYNYGDSLRHVAWNLSAKRGELLVKEFEKVSNAEISIVLNLDSKGQVGSRELSTWELSKDIALSLVSQQSELNNSVSIFSQDFFLEDCGSQHSLHLLSKKLMAHDPFDQNSEFEQYCVEKLMRRHLSRFRAGTNLFFITPYLSQESSIVVSRLSSLTQLGVNCICIFIDTSSFQNSLSRKIEFSEQFIAPSSIGIDATVEQLRVNGVSCVVAKAKEPISQSFAKMKGAV